MLRSIENITLLVSGDNGTDRRIVLNKDWCSGEGNIMPDLVKNIRGYISDARADQRGGCVKFSIRVDLGPAK